MLKQIFDGWQTWIWVFAAIFFQTSQPVISFACIFLFGLLLSRDFFTKKYSKDIDYLVSSYSLTLVEISATNPEIINKLKSDLDNVLEKAHPEKNAKPSKEITARRGLLRKVLKEYDAFFLASESERFS